MNRFLISLLSLVLLVLSAVWPLSSATAADASSFNPVPIQVVAESSGGVPVGTIIAWPVAANPKDADKWLECNGQAVNAAVYPELAAIVGGNVPDYRGLFLRGYGSQASYHYGGVWHSSGGLGVIQGDAIRNISGRIWSNSNNSDVQAFGEVPADSLQVSGAFTPIWGRTWTSPEDTQLKQHLTGFDFDASRTTPVANEIRPVNKAVRYFVRAKP